VSVILASAAMESEAQESELLGSEEAQEAQEALGFHSYLRQEYLACSYLPCMRTSHSSRQSLCTCPMPGNKLGS
jgi:hypothetical protein